MEHREVASKVMVKSCAGFKRKKKYWKGKVEVLEENKKMAARPSCTHRHKRIGWRTLKKRLFGAS